MIRTAGDTIVIATAATTSVSSGRHVGDSITISESVSVGGASSVRTASDFIAVDDVASVLFSAGPVTARRAESSRLFVEAGEHRIVPDVRADLAKNKWDLTTVGFGASLGGIVGRVPGAVVGGAVCYVWGQWRWRSAGKGP